MIIFSAILFFLLVIAIKVSAIVFVTPIVMGLVVIIGGNYIRKSKHGSFAPAWWNILSVLITIISTALFWIDTFNDRFNCGPVPFIILIFYALGSFIYLNSMKKSKKEPISKIKTIVTPKKVSKSHHRMERNKKHR